MKHTLKNRLLAFALTIVTIFGLCAPAQATSIADGSKTCTIALGARSNILETTAGTILRAGDYTYTTNDGLSGPAYCIDHGLEYTDRVLPITGKYTASPATAGAFANGYPQHSLETFLGLYLDKNAVLEGLTEAEYAYATQVAVWATLGQLGVDGTAYTAGREYLNPPTGDAQQARVFRAAQLILDIASTWNTVYQTGMYIRLDEEKLDGNITIDGSMTLEFAAARNQYGIKCEVINGVPYYTREYIFASATSTYYSDYSIELWAENAPSGTIFTDLNNVELTRSNFRETATWRLPTEAHYDVGSQINNNGYEYWGKAKLCIPAETTPNSGKITVNCGAYVMQYEIYLANNEEYSEQSYIIADPSKGTQTANALLSWGSDMTEVGHLQVTKVGGGGAPLSGAEFTLTGTDGTSRTATTDENGTILWTNLDPHTFYTLTETKAPAGYAVQEARNVTITAAQTTYETVKDDPQHTLTVHKQDVQNGYSLYGAVFKFEQIDGSYETTATTDHAGNIQFNADNLPIGSYKVYEVQAPAGYVVDPTAQTVNWDGSRDVVLTFRDTRETTLILSKQDSTTGYNLPGASFEVYKDGSLVTTVTTNEAGLAYVSGVSSGYYEVKEIATPEGYALNSEVFGVNIDPYDPATEDDPRLVVTNDPLPSLKITKYDRASHTPLEGVTFEVFRDTVSLGKFTTDAQGEILLDHIDPGTYKAVEVDTGDDSHILTTTPQEVELHAGDGVRELVFFNDLLPGLHLIKVDAADLSTPIPNAVFSFAAVDGSYGPVELTTGEDGTIDLSKLPTGAYVVTELACPGYVVDDAQRIIQLDGNETAQFVFTNTKLPSFVLTKTNANGDPLAGVTFRIAYVEDGAHYMDRTTDANGQIVLDGLEPGVLSVVETATLPNYILDPTEHHVELTEGKTATIDIKNDKRPNLTIHKRDADTEEPVPGTVFQVKEPDGAVLYEVTTGSDGSVTVENMLPGVYEIVEKSVPSNYLLDAEDQTVTLFANTDREVTFYDHKKPGLTVNKVDSITGDPLSGVKFNVTYASNNTSTGEINDLGTYITDENGRFFLTGLQDGWYKVTELEARTGYALADPAVQACYIKAGENKSLTFENTPLSALVVWKYDSVTGVAVEGAVFQVKYLSGTSGTGGTVIGTYKTSVNGSFTVTGLEAGTYIVEELASDSGHVIDTSPQTAYLSGEDQDVVQLYFGNSPKASLTVKKIDSVTREPLSDVEFMVTLADGSVVGDANGKFVTDGAGSFTIDGLTPGTTLVVKETRARDGYILDDTAQTITVQAGQAASLEFRNQPLGTLVITKLDSVTKEPLEGVRFEIIYADGSYVDAQGGTVSSNGIYTTDANGQIILTGIVGTVVVTETASIDGYVIDENTRTQTVTVNSNDTQSLTFYNDPVGGVEIIKVSSADTSARLSGAVFEIRRMDGGLVSTVTTGSRGRVYLALDAGSYYAVEVESPSGYQLDATPHYFTVSNGKTATLKIANDPFSGIVIHKTDSVTGDGIYGVTFLLYDAGKNPIGEYVSDQNGYVYIDDLVSGGSGRFYLRELEAAPGYELDTQYKTVHFSAGKTVEIDWENSPITGQIQVYKYAAEYNEITGAAAGTPLQGAVYEISEARSGKVVDYITTDARGVAASDPLPLGRYKIVEVTAPAYYQLDSTVFDETLEYSGQIIKLSAYDKSAKLGVSITKRGNAEVLAGSQMRYDITVANTSNVDLENFFWHDRIPTDAARATVLTTGTYSARLNYRVLYKTNYTSDYQVLASNLLTSSNYSFALNAIPMQADEVVTDVYFDFGTVPVGFQSVTKPTLTVQVLATTVNGYQLVNRADTGGKYQGTWQTANANWVTIIRKLTTTPSPTLPKTGY